MAVTTSATSPVINWWTQGVQIAPVGGLAVGTVLADSGALPVGTYRLHITIAATAALFAQVEWWNVDGTPVLRQAFALAVPVSGGHEENIDVTDDGSTHQIKITMLSP